MRLKGTYTLILIIALFSAQQNALAAGRYSPAPFKFFGFDGDGIADAADLDDDNDGIPDLVEDANTDLDGDPYTNPTDSDGDGYPDIQDLDSDGDGILDIIEAGGVDADMDGMVDGFTDADMDGYDDAIEAAPLPYIDFDADGLADTKDIDSDNDGIPDNIEGGPSNAYNPPVGFDTDGDGIDNGYDIHDGGTPIIPQDLDTDSILDMHDLDTDNDGEGDLIEGHDTNGDGTPENSPSSFDSDNDGLDDSFDVDGGSATNAGGGSNGGALPTDFPDEDIPGIGELDWREFDNDADGIQNYQDVDDDNDGIPDYVEVCGGGATSFTCIADPVLDSDGDGTINYRDPDYGVLNGKGVTASLDWDGDGVIDMFDRDSDNDGLSDVFEAGFEDANHDNKIDDLFADGILMHDTDLNGWSDSLFTTDPRDIDSLTQPDYKDLDADNDGIYDIIENHGTDIDDNGKLDVVLADSTLVGDIDGDGISNTAAFTRVEDLDGDGYGNFTDHDSDNDGMADIFETQLTDVNNDGMIDAHADGDGDGADDTFMNNGIDADGDGVPDYRDFDSDNDLIADVAEVGLVDLDSDGSLDSFIDVNQDGWDDNQFITNPVNTDSDGGADWRDGDADNDGITDVNEGGNLGLDVNDDGVVDGFSDGDGDGWHDTNQTSSEDVPDTDNDGTPDYQDLDSDNDESPDSEEWDANGDGITPDDCNEDGIYDWLDSAFCDVVVPQGFSPNGDGINDLFVLVGTAYYPNSKITIFARSGQKVFEAENYQNDWDGTNMFAKDGTVELPTGTYFYVFEPERDGDDGRPLPPVRGYVYLSR